MNVFYKATLATMRKNRVRTLVTILGVILSAAMVCAVTTIVSSLRGFYQDYAIYDSGDWYSMVSEADGALRERLSHDSRVSQVASAQILGYAQSESRNEDKPYIYLLGADETFFSAMPIHYTGSLPQNPGELLVPEHYISLGNGGANVQLGDTLTLSLGERTSEGFSLNQDNPYTEEEALEVRTTAVYTVVGFYERPDFEDYSAPGYTFLTVPEAEGPQRYTLYYKTARADDLQQVMTDYNLLDEKQNWNLLAAQGSFRYDNFYRVLNGFATILIVLIMVGSVSLIYSAFSISVSERTRQFGLLRSVGATRKQLRRSVFFEAAVVSALGIPIGVACGIGGIGVTLALLEEKFRSVFSSEVPVRLHVSWIAVAAAVLVSLITVAVSVWIPAKRATRVTAMEAIRQSREIRGGERDVKVSRLTRKLFGLEGTLAKKYFRRSRSRYRATVVSLTLSVALFISASTFCMYLTDTVDNTMSQSNYDVCCYLDGTNPEEVFPALLEARGVIQGTYLQETWQVILMSPEQLDGSFVEFLRKSEQPGTVLETEDIPTELLDGDTPIALRARVCYVDDQSYRAFLECQGLDASLYLDAENPLPLVYSRGTGVYYVWDGQSSQRLTCGYRVLKASAGEVQARVEQTPEGYYYSETRNWSFNLETGEETAGPAVDSFYNPETEETLYLPTRSEPLPLGAHVTEVPIGVDEDGAGCILLYPYSAAPAESLNSVTACFTSSNHRETTEDLEKLLLEKGLYTGTHQVYDVRASESTERSMIVIINVFSYGFIALISLISAANVFNTISTNVALRRREFAMLRSVGMTRGGLNRMMNYECLLYGLRSLAFGLPLAGLMFLWIYKTALGATEETFRLPWTSIAVAVCSVFVVVFVTMVYAMRKIKRENPIDALKNENI